MVLSVTVVAAVSGVIATPAMAAGEEVDPRSTQTVYSDALGSDCERIGKPVTVRKAKKIWLYRFPDGALREKPEFAKESDRLSRERTWKGRNLCRMNWSLGPLGVERHNGVVTGIRTPGYPTPKDIKNLGLTIDTPVAENVMIPRPNKPLAPARDPESIKPIRVRDEPANPATGEPVTRVLDWEFTGGSGLIIQHRTRLIDGERVHHYSVTELDPNGSDEVAHRMTSCDKGAGPMADYSGGTATSNYGQAHLPRSMTYGWSSTPGMTAFTLGQTSTTNSFNALLHFDEGGQVSFEPVEATSTSS